MTTDYRTDFRKLVDTIIDKQSLVVDNRVLTQTSIDRRQLDHAPMVEKRDGRTADRRGSKVLNSTMHPAGGPNGKIPLITIDTELRHAIIDRKTVTDLWTRTPGTDEHELAQLDKAVEDENRALKTCCQNAADEIFTMIWNTFTTSTDPRSIERTEYAAVIYKHMRNGREL